MAEYDVIYKAAPGSRLTHSEARVLGETIAALGGGITPEDLLKEARKKRSPIHDLFEWDDQVAAEAFRLEQARYFLRSVWEVPVDRDGREAGDGARAFYAVEISDANERKSKAFFAAREIRDVPGADAQILERALKEANEWQQRYRRIRNHLEDVFDAIDTTTKRLTTKKGGKKRAKRA
jgi:hypothetical protein